MQQHPSSSNHRQRRPIVIRASSLRPGMEDGAEVQAGAGAAVGEGPAGVALVGDALDGDGAAAGGTSAGAEDGGTQVGEEVGDGDGVGSVQDSGWGGEDQDGATDPLITVAITAPTAPLMAMAAVTLTPMAAHRS